MKNEEVEELTSRLSNGIKQSYEENSVFSKGKEVECKQRCISKTWWERSLSKQRGRVALVVWTEGGGNREVVQLYKE